jgi:hypothetical protein
MKSRIYTERGTLSLFFAAFVALNSESAPQPRDVAAALNLLTEAKTDLKRCLELEHLLAGAPIKYLLARLQMQYVPMIAAVEVIRFLLTSPEEYVFDGELKQHVSRVRDYMKVNGDRSFALVKAEMHVFFMLAGEDDGTCADEIKLITSEGPELPLALDRFVLEALRIRFVRK